MSVPYRIKQSHKPDVPQTCPSSERGEVLVEHKKPPLRIVQPKGSLTKIEKDIVKRKTQLFEQGEAATGHQANTTSVKTQKEDASPLYKPSFEAPSNYTRRKSNDDSEHKSSDVVPGYPYKPKADASISKSISAEVKTKLEELNLKKTSPPDRPKLPPSPVYKDKPRYPYKPSVENEIDAHGKATNKFPKQPQNITQTTKLTVNTGLNTKDDKNTTSPKSPSPPIRPPPPKFQNTDKKVSTLIAHKSKLFEGGEELDFAKGSKPVDKSESKPKERKSSVRVHFESVHVDGGVPKLVNNAQKVTDEGNKKDEKGAGNSEIPQYGQVNKAKKVLEKDLKFQTEQTDLNSLSESVLPPRPHQSKHVVSASSGGSQDSGNSLQTLPKRHTTTEKPVPPSKPPRTFAHDEYMKIKSEKQKKKQHLGTPSPLAVVHNYEEIASNSAKPPPPFKPSQIRDDEVQPSEVYEEIAQPSHVTNRSVLSQKPKPISTSQDIAVKKTYTYDKLDDSAVFVKPSIPASKPVVPVKPGQTEIDTLKKNEDKARWDKGVVRIKSSNIKLKKEPIISKKAISNPGYEHWDHECIPIKTVYKDGTLKRYKSDEFLYAENLFQKQNSHGGNYSEEPLYQDPADVVKGHQGRGFVNSHGVAFDGDGYAVPEAGPSHAKHNRYQKREMKRIGTMAYGTLHPKGKVRTGAHSNASVKEKVSEAYAVLRRKTVRQENGAEGDSTGCYKLEDAEDSDSDLDTDEHQKHLEYVSTTKLRIKNSHHRSVYEKAMLKPPQDARQVQQLFDYGLIVGLEEVDDTKICKPKVLHCFPHQKNSEKQKETRDLGIICSFCFPDASIWRPVSQYRTENFSFVLTASDGSRQYGYCCRFLPPSDQNTIDRLPEVFCLVSSVCAWNFYADFLKELQKKRNNSIQLAHNLLQLAYGKPMPDPGKEVWIRCPGDKESAGTVIMKRSADERLDKVSPRLLLEKLSVDNLLKVFSSLLMERRLVFVAQHLGTLTDCIHALLSLLYPFTWEHTFIPILPGELLEVCDAPTPYVVGVLAGHYIQIQEMEITDVLIIDLNNDAILKCMGDESSILPTKLQKALRTALKPDSSAKSEKDLMVSEAFLRMFLETVGHYTDFINVQQDGVREFHRDSFVRAVSSKSIRMFLEWFSETQMFEMFVTNKMDNPGHTEGLFEQRLEDYRDEMDKLGPNVKRNIKDAGKRFINFFKESGGKIKKVFD